MLVPTVIQQNGRGERAYHICSRLLRDNLIFIGAPIDDALANRVIAQLLFLAAEDPQKDIQLYINSFLEHSIFTSAEFARGTAHSQHAW